LLGLPEHEVRSRIGEPTIVNEEDFGDGDITRTWEYEKLGLFLTFSEDDEFRLGIITTENESATLNGLRIIGISEQQLLDAQFGDLGSPELEDDFEENGKDYVWDAASLSCWVSDGIVNSVSIIPLYDETGQIPKWPNAVA